MYTKEAIRETIRFAVKKVTGIKDIDDDMFLGDETLKIAPANFIYIFDIIEKQLELPIHKVVETHSFMVMTINNLATATFELSTVSHM